MITEKQIKKKNNQDGTKDRMTHFNISVKHCRDDNIIVTSITFKNKSLHLSLMQVFLLVAIQSLFCMKRWIDLFFYGISKIHIFL